MVKTLMNMLTNVINIVPKMLKDKNNVIMLLVFLAVLLFALNRYNYVKIPMLDTMANENESVKKGDDLESPQEMVSGVTPSSSNEEYATAKGLSTDTHGLGPSCNSNTTINPSDLLPNDENSEWAKLNPHGVGDLSEVNLVKAGHAIGVNTVGTSLRNANQQLRSDPPVPQVNVGPWNNTTIEPDGMRVPLELGSRPNM
jgi:hypothetical protein